MGETLETFGWSLCQIDVYREFERRNHKCSFGLYLANECLVSFAGCNRLSGVLGVCKGPSMRMDVWGETRGSWKNEVSMMKMPWVFGSERVKESVLVRVVW